MVTAMAAERTVERGQEIKIRAIEPGEDLERVLELVRASLGEGSIPRTDEYWMWKHTRNPFGASAVLIAEAGGQLVGLRVFMRWDWRRGAERFRAVRAVDTATHPDFQGRGIFSRLTRELVERMRADGVDFIFNTPNSKSRPGYLKMGWHAVGRTDLAIAPLRPVRVVRAMLRQTSGEGNDFDDRPTPHGAMTMNELVDHPLFGRLVSAVERDAGHPLRTPKSVEYFRWRYAEVPGFRYHAVAEFDGIDGAAIVFRLKSQGTLRELRICDFLIGPDPNSTRIAAKLLRRLRGMSDADYLSVMPAHPRRDRAWFMGRGFLPAPRIGPILTVRPLNPPLEEAALVDRRNWGATIGDLELF